MNTTDGAEGELQASIEQRLSEWRTAKQQGNPHGYVTVADEANMRRCVTELERVRKGLPLGPKMQGNQTNPDPHFFERNREDRVELIEGLLREGQLAAFAGPFGMGKSPVLADLTVRFIHGLEWCGRKLARRPVIVFDCETAGPDYRRAVTAIASRLGVTVPRVPDDLDVYLEHDPISEANTTALVAALANPGHVSKLDLICRALQSKPNAVVLVDPLEMLFRLDTGKKKEVLELYRDLRTLLAKFQKAVLLMTFNLRKKDRKNARADLLSSPRDWLEEVCGSLDILNRSDVRLGIDIQRDDVRVINGIVRGREMHPILIRTFMNADEHPAGFEQVAPDQLEVFTSLTSNQRTYWEALPQQFKFEEIADKTVPRSTLSRLIKATTSFGALSKGDDGMFRKVG